MRKYLFALSALALLAVLSAGQTVVAEDVAYCPPPPPMCPPPPPAPVCSEPVAAKKYVWEDEEYTVTEKRYETILETRTRTKTNPIKVRAADKTVYDARIAQLKPVNGKATRLARGATRRIQEVWKDDVEKYEEEYTLPVRQLVHVPTVKTRRVAHEVVAE